MIQGDESCDDDNAVADDGCTDCMADEGYLCSGEPSVCVVPCDPLLLLCLQNHACMPALNSEFFTCYVDASGDLGAPGDVCEVINGCDPGLFCADPASVPDCQGSGCCSRFCDLTTKDPNEFCWLLAGQECVAWYVEGEAPPGYEHVGACMLPP